MPRIYVIRVKDIIKLLRQNNEITYKELMKKMILMSLLLICGVTFAAAQAEIKFDKLTHNFGTFSYGS